jgi:hypothetical protein
LGIGIPIKAIALSRLHQRPLRPEDAVGLNFDFNSGTVESQKNLRVVFLECWLNTQHGWRLLGVPGVTATLSFQNW